MKQQELIPHLFRTEFCKITAVLCRHLGIAEMGAAEDIASDTFVAALETWPYNGLPDNPVGWLHTVALNKMRNYLQRRDTYNKRVKPQLVVGEVTEALEPDLSDKNIADSQLRMLFALCHPSLSAEAQIELSLRILCGFGIDEIASAFLAKKETITKRLYRAREQLRAEPIELSLPSAKETHARLGSVLTTLYLLFSEGYYSESNNEVLRENLCFEALRITYLLVGSDIYNTPEVSALMALMCFKASGFSARKVVAGMPTGDDENETVLWERELIARGVHYLRAASVGANLSKYHLEATIAYWHTVPEDSEEKWATILRLFDQLVLLDASPVVQVNRCYAVARVRGKEEAIKDALMLEAGHNQYYFSLLGELYAGIDNNAAANYLQHALSLARTDRDRALVRNRLEALLK